MTKTQTAPQMSNRDRKIAAHRAEVLAQEATWRAMVEQAEAPKTEIDWTTVGAN